jgi:hypothetical protein
LGRTWWGWCPSGCRKSLREIELVLNIENNLQNLFLSVKMAFYFIFTVSYGWLV